MKEIVVSILSRCNFKGNFIGLIKKAGCWDIIEKISGYYPDDITNVEKVYLYLNAPISIICENGFRKKYRSLSLGYTQYCQTTSCKICKKKRLEANKAGLYKKYGVDNAGKLSHAISAREEFWNDPDRIKKSREQTVITCLEKYGVSNPMKTDEIKHRQRESIFESLGVYNPSQSEDIKQQKVDTCFRNYGVEYPLQSPIIQQQVKDTNLEKYGVEYPCQNQDIIDKMLKTKIENGSFAKSNSSMEATLYLRQYYLNKGYELSQVAFDDIENNLHEWGYYSNKWYLYDFVAFELGYRGNSNKILEIVEYHGPFHYSIEDVDLRGDDKAFPWKSNNTTIFESYLNDENKKQLANTLTSNYKVIWAPKWHT